MRFWFSRTRNNEVSATDGTSEAKYDVDKWRDVIKHDEGIAAVAENLRPLGDKWVNEFARNYLSLNDKKRTWSIVQKVIEDAKRERGRAGI